MNLFVLNITCCVFILKTIFALKNYGFVLHMIDFFPKYAGLPVHWSASPVHWSCQSTCLPVHCWSAISALFVVTSLMPVAGLVCWPALQQLIAGGQCKAHWPLATPVLTWQFCVHWPVLCSLVNIVFTGQSCAQSPVLDWLASVVFIGQCCVNWSVLC